MIIENIKTGQRFEVAPETNFPKTAYRVVTAEAKPIAEPKAIVPPVVVKKPTKKAPKKKTTKKKTKK